MNPILTVMRKEVRESLRDRRSFFASILFGPVLVPAMFALIIALTMRHDIAQTDAPLEVAVSHFDRAPNLMARLSEHNVILIRTQLDDAGAREAVRTGRFKAVLLIPPAYGQQIRSGAPAPLRLYADSSDVSAQRDTSRVRLLLAQYGSTLARLRLMARGVDPLLLDAVAVEDVDVATPADRSLVVLGALTLLIVLTMLMAGLHLAIDATAGERERGSLEPLLTVPVRREQLVYGKLLAACAFMLLSLSLTISALAIVLHFAGLERLGMTVNLGPASVLASAACCAPLAPLGAAFMTIVAAYTRTYREAQTYVGLTLLVPTLPLMFVGIMGLKPTAWLMLIPSLGQHFLVTRILRAEPIPPLHLLLSFGMTLALGVLLMWVAGRLYRRESLLG
ncbi:MAG TPA: ABC transporter permease [Steroidobacteraceae bacterium]